MCPSHIGGVRASLRYLRVWICGFELVSVNDIPMVHQIWLLVHDRAGVFPGRRAAQVVCYWSHSSKQTIGDEMRVLGDLGDDQERVDTSLAAQALLLAAVGVGPLSLLSEVSLPFECESYRYHKTNLRRSLSNRGVYPH